MATKKRRVSAALLLSSAEVLFILLDLSSTESILRNCIGQGFQRGVVAGGF